MELIKTKKTKITLLITFGILVILMISTQFNTTYTEVAPKTSTLHGCISISGNAALDAFCAGNGTDGLSWGTAHVIENYEIDAADTIGIKIYGTDRYLIIRNCEISTTIVYDPVEDFEDRTGITLEACHNVMISGCQLYDNPGGILIYQSTDIIISNNIESGALVGIGLFTRTKKCIISNNICNDNIDAGVGAGVGVSLHHYSDNNTITNNTFSGNNLFGIVTMKSSDNIFSYNRIAKNGEAGIYVRDDCFDTKIFENKFCGNPKNIDDNGVNTNIHDNYSCSPAVPSYSLLLIIGLVSSVILVLSYQFLKKIKILDS